MTIKYERLYGVPATCQFVLWESDGISINATASSVLGDIAISQDFGPSANTTHFFSAHDDGMGHQIILATAEMEASKILIRIVDQDSTKEWLDEVLLIETYGNENSQHNRRQSGIVLETVIASASGNAEFVIVDKPNDNNTLLNCVAVIHDNSGPGSPTDRTFRDVIAYTGATGTVELNRDADFTITSGDRVVFLPTADIQSADDIASAVWDITRASHTDAGTFGEGVLVESLNATASAQVSANTGAVLANANILDTDDLPTNFGSFAITGAGQVTVDTNNDKTDYYLAVSAYQSAASVALVYDWTSAVADQGEPTTAARNTLQALRFLRNNWDITGNILTVTREDDATEAWEATLTTVASANAVTQMDPN